MGSPTTLGLECATFGDLSAKGNHLDGDGVLRDPVQGRVARPEPDSDAPGPTMMVGKGENEFNSLECFQMIMLASIRNWRRIWRI